MSAAGATELQPPRTTSFQPRLAGTRLWCRTLSDFGALEHLRPEWDELAASSAGGISSSYDWCRTWWRHYGRSGEARIFLFHDEHGMAAAVPMMIEQVRLGPISLRLARPIGSTHTQCLCSPPVRATWSTEVFCELLTRLLRHERCDAVCFGPLSQADATLAAARKACAARCDLGRIHHDRVLARHTTIALPGSFDDYLRSLSKNQRFDIRKSWKRLTDDHQVETRLIDQPPLLEEEFSAFVHMHQRQWRQLGMLGHFGDWPAAEPFNRDLVRTLGGLGRARLLQIRAGGIVAARQYGFRFGDGFHCRLAARSLDERWDCCSLGRTSLVRLFEALIAEGVRSIDAGVGDYDYKLRLGGRQHDVRSIMFVADRASSRTRAQALSHLADALDLLYYRLWFCRLAARSPFPRRPLWRSWISTRF